MPKPIFENIKEYVGKNVKFRYGAAAFGQNNGKQISGEGKVTWIDDGGLIVQRNEKDRGTRVRPVEITEVTFKDGTKQLRED